MTKPSRRGAIVQIVTAGAAFAASSLEALGARQSCGDSAGTLIDTLPLFGPAPPQPARSRTREPPNREPRP